MPPGPVASVKGNIDARVAGVKISYLSSTASGGLQGMLRILASMPIRAAGTSGGNGTIGGWPASGKGVRVAQKIQTLFIDDIDGSEAEGTVHFGLDGTEYEIDLNAKHAGALRKALSKYVDAGRRTTGRVGRPGRRGRRPAGGQSDNAEAREWAKAQGFEVKDRGRVPAELIVRFRAATRV